MIAADTRTTVQEALVWAVGTLDKSVDSPRVDAEVILRHVLACGRTDLYANSSRDIQGSDRDRFRDLVSRRIQGEPLQYIVGSQGFRGIELLVGRGVLVPRPETEVLVGRALFRIDATREPTVIDLGTGSGAIALAIANERPDARVWATDISAEALWWADRNLKRGGHTNVQILEAGDLFATLPGNLKGTFDLVVANPPYLSQAELDVAPVEVRDHEPHIAMLSGPTGLEMPRRVIEESIEWLVPEGWLVMEISPDRADQVQGLLQDGYAQVGIHADLAGRARVTEGMRPAE